MADIEISGEIGWETSAKEIRKQFKAISPKKDITIDLSTVGGSVYQGIEISNLIRNHKGKTNLTVTGVAASMGSYIMQRADTTAVYDDSIYMMHNPWVITAGDYKELEKDAADMKALARMMAGAYSAKSGKSKKEISKMLDDTTWLYGQEIIDAGFADELIKTEDPESKEDAVAFAKLQFNECLAKLRKFEEENKENKKIAALLTQEPRDEPNQPAKPPVKPQPKKDKMTKEEFLAYLELNPEAKPFFDAAIAAAKAEAQPVDYASLDFNAFLELKPEAKAEHEQIVADAKIEVETKNLTKDVAVKVGNIISSSAYGASIKAAGIKVLTGEKDYSSFEDLVAVADEMTEKMNSAAIKNEQPESTPGETHTLEAADKAKTIAAAKELGQKLGTAKQEV